MSKSYTDKEINFIKKNASSMTTKQIAKKLKRTPKAINHRLSKLQLKCVDGRIKEDLPIGEKFGCFTILGPSEKAGKFNCKYYICECVCKNVRKVPKFNLINGFSNSCGCVGRDKRQLLPQGESSINEKYAVCRYTAGYRKLEFFLTAEQFKEIVIQNCHYCGEKPKPYNRYIKKDGTPISEMKKRKVSEHVVSLAWANINTVDRIDSNEGYTVKNCVPACWPCNEAKMDTSYDDFIKRSYKIVEYQERKKNI